MVRPAVTDADNNELGITFTSAIGLLTYCQTKFIFIIDSEDQKQPFRDLPIKGRSVNLLHIFSTAFLKNTSEWLLPQDDLI